jgi:NADH dehydrogenase
MEAHKIVIIGAGFAGLRTALELEKRCARIKECTITLIDRNAEHLYTPLLYEVSSGGLEEATEQCLGELKSGVCVKFDDYVNIVKKKHIRFRRAEVVGINVEEQSVALKDGERIPYDDLVVAVGVETATYGIPGVAEHALPMKTLADAFRIREKIYRFVSAYKGGKERHLAIIVVGGGATGVEFAAETANFFQRLVEGGVLQWEDFEVRLVEAGSDILMMFPPEVRRLARRRLSSLGVEVMTETKLNEVKPGTVTITGKDGQARELEADAAVWTAGVKPLGVGKDWGLPTDEKGFIIVDQSFAVEGMKNAYALGDCVALVHPKTKARVPALAQVAVREAGVVAENIARHLERKLPLRWNPPEKWATVVPMGGKYAIADVGPIRLYGRAGYAVRKAADLMYFLSILPPREGWKLWRTGARVYLNND